MARRAPRTHALVRHIVTLESIGWRVISLRPDSHDPDVALWRVTIERSDAVISMTAIEPDPEVALSELVRFAHAGGK